jgi:hypothetical protein
MEAAHAIRPLALVESPTIGRMCPDERRQLERRLVAEILESVVRHERLIHRLADAGSDLGLLYQEYLRELDLRAASYGLPPRGRAAVRRSG